MTGAVRQAPPVGEAHQTKRSVSATASATAGPFLVEKLRALDARLEAVTPRVAASTDDAQAVHDLRVALRRMRTILEVGRAVLGRFQANEVRRALRDLQRASGELRDEEVLLELFTSLGVDSPGVSEWLEVRRARERRQRRNLQRSLQSGQLERGRRLLQALLLFPVKPSRDKRLSKVARRAVDRARRDVQRQRVARTDDPDALHQLRIAYKRLRYVVETFAEGLPSELADLAQPAARFQGRLGDLHDVDVAIAAVRRARALPERSRGDLLAALARVRVERLSTYAREIGLVNIAPAPPAGEGDRHPARPSGEGTRLPPRPLKAARRMPGVASAGGILGPAARNRRSASR
jgi:CHAD domain-containing protein